MKSFNLLVLCCLTFGLTYAHDNPSIEDLYNEGRMLIDQQEYLAALKIFGSVIESLERNPYVSHADQTCYLSAAFNSVLLSQNLQDFQGVERYMHLLAEASNDWFGYPLQISSHLLSQNSLIELGAFLHRDSHAWGVVWICTNCGRGYSSCPSRCIVCGNTSFVPSEMLPPGKG